MSKLPISVIIDDFAPVIHMSYEERANRLTTDGRPLLPSIPYEFLMRFCEVVEKHSVKGKLSMVPLPGTHNPYETKEGDWKGKKNHRRSNVWYGKNGTMVSVSYYAGCGTTINYSYTGADELLKNASYGNTSGL